MSMKTYLAGDGAADRREEHVEVDARRLSVRVGVRLNGQMDA